MTLKPQCGTGQVFDPHDKGDGLTKLIYKCIATIIKMPAPFLGELDKLNPAFTWKKHKLKYLDDF
jgi:hypothetical protein